MYEIVLYRVTDGDGKVGWVILEIFLFLNGGKLV